MLRLVLVFALVALATAGTKPMKMFELNENQKYEQVLVPVSSTVIPIDDLPTYKVGVGIKFDGVKPKGPKPKGPIKLITIHSKKNGSKNKNGAKVEEVTKEEYKKITKKQ